MPKKLQKNPSAIRNRKATFRYELLEKVECGIVLKGAEVKSIRSGLGSLEEAFARIHDGQVWLYGFHIPHYQHGDVKDHDPLRRRKLLLHKRQIAKIEPKLTLRGLTLVPVDVHFNERGLAKLTLALAKGKARRDKRQDIQEREAKREMDRAMRRR